MQTNLNPFDLRGPGFLIFYLVLLIATCVASYLVRRFAAATSDRDGPELQLDGYELAYLVGGAKRVMLLAIATLLDHKRVAIHRGQMEILSDSDRASHVVERMILREPSRQMSMRAAQKAIDPACENIKRAMQGQALLAGDAATGLSSSATAVLFLVTLFIGISKLIVGVQRDRPIGLLIMLLIAAAVLGLVMLNLPPLLTPRGRKLVAKLKRDLPKGAAAVSQRGLLATDTTIAAMVALWGVSALAGHPDHEQLKRHDASSWSGSGGDSGGSCSGGDGGGCGGCGGD